MVRRAVVLAAALLAWRPVANARPPQKRPRQKRAAKAPRKKRKRAAAPSWSGRPLADAPRHLLSPVCRPPKKTATTAPANRTGVVGGGPRANGLVAALVPADYVPWAPPVAGNVTRAAPSAAGVDVAVLFTGFLKTTTAAALEKHARDAAGADVFAVTYAECAGTAARLAPSRVRLVSAAEKASFAAFLEAHPNGAPNHTWQWFQIKLAFATWDFSS